MAVNAYDKSTAFRQDAIARFGDRYANTKPMNDEQRKAFNNSPFMQQARKLDDAAFIQLSERDKKRAANDKEFKPQDDDFNAPKAFAFDKSVNYYKALGVDEYASVDEVKKSYRKLSLTYHPDKSLGLTQEEKDERATIFIEVKNAYKTLSDQATRRQYDHERDREKVSANTYGGKVKESVNFDAELAMRVLESRKKENKLGPSQTVQINIRCRLEKFVYGGHKAYHMIRQVKSKDDPDEFEAVDRVFRMDIRKGCPEPFTNEFRRQGDQHHDRYSDNLKFVLTSKPHEVVDRRDAELFVRTPVELRKGWDADHILTAQTPSIRGRHILLWGQNPFFGCESRATRGILNIRILGEGASPEGRLHITAVGSLQNHSTSGRQRCAGGAPMLAPSREHLANSLSFMQRFGLGPPWGTQEEQFLASETTRSWHREGGAQDHPTIQQRLERRLQLEPSCDLELEPFGGVVDLYTKPVSSITFYSNLRQSSKPRAEGTLAPRPMLAICLCAPSCAKGKATPDWERLKRSLAPVLQTFCFGLLRVAQYVLPRALPPVSVRFARSRLLRADVPVPWKQVGDGSLRQGDYWHAALCYSNCIKTLPESGDDAASGADDTELDAAESDYFARALSNRAACFAKIGDFVASLADARRAAGLAPKFARAWSRIGFAVWHLDGPSQEACDAHFKALALEPTGANANSLHTAVSAFETASAESAHEAKEKGSEALRVGELGEAVAMYTLGLARLPAGRGGPDDTALTSVSGAEGQPPPTGSGPAGGAAARLVAEEHALLHAVLLTNRASAFLRLRLFDLAVTDARQAVSVQPTFVKARCMLGAALLGSMLYEQAYAEFAKALQMDLENSRAQKGRRACLALIPRWLSVPARTRLTTRFSQDFHRPKGSTRIFAVSDIHFDQQYNEDWAHKIDGYLFQDDVLIVAGNVADTRTGVGRCLTTLKSKFRRVFYTVGNHEMQITPSEAARIPDSIAKLNALLADCDELGVDVVPAPVCEGLFVVPLLSWYSADFDEADPFPNPRMGFDSRCKWPIDPDEQVWRYMQKLNEEHLQQHFDGTVLTCSHFLPRRELPWDTTLRNTAKVVGNERIDEQVRALGSKLHVYGHSRRKYAQVHAGVRYVNMPVGFDNERIPGKEPQLMLVHNGRNVCMQEWDIDGMPPDGALKRLQYTTFLWLKPLGEKENKAVVKQLEQAARRLGDALRSGGVQVSFGALGSGKQNKAQLEKDAWKDLGMLSAEATHGLLVVADSVGVLKDLLQSAPFGEWTVAVKAHSRNACTVCAPLGVDLATQVKRSQTSTVMSDKEDPMVVFYLLRLRPEVTEDSEEFAKIQKVVTSINKLPGGENKIAVTLQSTGFGARSMQELLEDLGVNEDTSGGFTHCFTMALDAPTSLKLLLASKTFERFKKAVEAELGKPEGVMRPTIMAFALPMGFSVMSAAPKPDPKEAKKKIKR